MPIDPDPSVASGEPRSETVRTALEMPREDGDSSSTPMRESSVTARGDGSDSLAAADGFGEGGDAVDQPADVTQFSLPAVIGVHAAESGDTVATDGRQPGPDRSKVLACLEGIRGDLAELFGLEQRHTAIIERLHAENMALRQGELVQAVKPLLSDLARLHDDVSDVIAHGGEALKKAAIIPELIADVLSRHGVARIAPELGDPFDAKQHQAVDVMETGDPALGGKVCAVRRPGFVRDGEYLVRPALVGVYRFAPVATTQNTNTAESESIG